MNKANRLELLKQILWMSFFFSIFMSSSPAIAVDENELWQKLGSEHHFALIRHALAPGVGDPDYFILERCETQRNLSERGRKQSQYIGQLFRDHGIDKADVYSSQWCRCLETAGLLEFENVIELPLLNSFFRNFEDEEKQTSALLQWLDKQDLQKNIILITHQVNITALTGIFPSSGEIVVMKKIGPGNYTPIGTIKTQ